MGKVDVRGAACATSLNDNGWSRPLLAGLTLCKISYHIPIDCQMILYLLYHIQAQTTILGAGCLWNHVISEKLQPESSLAPSPF